MVFADAGEDLAVEWTLQRCHWLPAKTRATAAFGDSEDETFWTALLRGLKRRGLTGVQLVISDAHEGI